MNNYYHLRINGFISKAGQELHLQGELINSENKQRTEVKIPMSDLIDAFTALSKDVSLNSINDIPKQVNNSKQVITNDNSVKDNQSNTDITEKKDSSNNEMPSLSDVHAGIDLNQGNDDKSDNYNPDNKENSQDNGNDEETNNHFHKSEKENISNESEKDNGKVKDAIVDPDDPFEKEQIDDQLPNFTDEEIAAVDAANKIRTEQNKTSLNNLNPGMVDDDDDE